MRGGVGDLVWLLVALVVVPVVVVTVTAAIVAIAPARHDDTRRYRLAVLRELTRMLQTLTRQGVSGRGISSRPTRSPDGEDHDY